MLHFRQSFGVTGISGWSSTIWPWRSGPRSPGITTSVIKRSILRGRRIPGREELFQSGGNVNQCCRDDYIRQANEEIAEDRGAKKPSVAGEAIPMRQKVRRKKCT